MHSLRVIGAICVTLLCVSTVMADSKPTLTVSTEQGISQRDVQAKATDMTFADSKPIARTQAIESPASDEPSPESITRSPDGSSFHFVMPEREEGFTPDKGLDGESPRGGCGDPEAGSCCEAHEGPFCDNGDCCEIVCYMFGMTWCCEEGWDEECASTAQQYCSDACGPPTAACCFGDACQELTREDCDIAGGRWFNNSHCDSFTCLACPAEDSLFTQEVSSWATYFGTYADADATSYTQADRFWDVHGDICGVSFIGNMGDPDWHYYCEEAPQTFEIIFYEDDGGIPGSVLHTYTVSASGTLVSDYDLGWVQFTVDLQPCVSLENGFISIKAVTGGPDCVFSMIGAADPEGDGTHCSYNPELGYWDCPPVEEYWAFDLNFCLLGTLYPGACCDEVAGTCDDNVQAADCPATSRFVPGVLCDDMNPPCGALAGACCIPEAPYCYIEAAANCTGTYLGDGTICDTNDCNDNGVPDACDLACGGSSDCNNNGIPDECDIAAGAEDWDGNGIPDECEADCNDNGVVDACDISCAAGDCGTHPGGCGISLDCQPNGVPDECELGTLGDPTLWDNGDPNDTRALRSQVGGSLTTLTVDDVALPNGGVINGIHWTAEETSDWLWLGMVHIYIFGDNGEGGPDDANEILHIVVPSDDGSVIRTVLGDGALYDVRCDYDVYGLNIPLGPGIWWIGLAPEGSGQTAASRWCSSKTGAAISGGEACLRASGAGITLFVPWTQQGAPEPHDASFTLTTTFFGADCNDNGIPDDCDIANCDGSAWCQDCQGNGIPDGCEEDCNGNQIPDQCDILFCDGSTWCGDCDHNQVLDECQVPPLGSEADCNENGSPDACDIASGSSPDCNTNGIPDECDIASGFSDDYDSNGIPDDCDPDCNGNGVVDVCDTSCSVGECGSHPLGCEASLDCQDDFIPDECQLFSEAVYSIDDGSQDNGTGLTAGGSLAFLNQFVVENDVTTISKISVAWGGVATGTPATVYLWSDPNNDGAPNDAVVLASAPTTTAFPETNTFITVDIDDIEIGPNGTSFFAGVIITHAQGEHPAALDESGTGTGWIAGSTSGSVDPNHLAQAPVGLQPYVPAWMVRAVGLESNDCNDTGIPDECDIAAGTSQDCDANGIPDECEWMDCNNNGIHDPCDLLDCDGSEWCSDCNANNIIDQCDISSGTSSDCQPDGIPDECQMGGSIAVFEETFYSTNWMGDDPLPEGWDSVRIVGDVDWIVTGNWGCEYEGGAVIYGNSWGMEDKGGDYIDVYLVSPEITGQNFSLNFCTNGCTSDDPDCEALNVDLMLVVGDVGGTDDVFVGSVDELWDGSFAQGEFDLAPFAPVGPYRLAFRYHTTSESYFDVLIDQVVLSRPFPGSDCNDNDIPDFCDLRDCDGSVWCGDCNDDGILNECQTGFPGGLTYAYDNGTSEGGLGTGGDLVELVWLQQYEAQPGSETIIGISTCFGSPYGAGGSGVSAGDPFRVFLWDDPNNDGNPNDAVLLAQATAQVSGRSIDTDDFQTVAITPTTVSGKFFVAAAVVSSGYPAPMDRDGVFAEKSWVTAAWLEEGEDPFDPTVPRYWDSTTSSYACNWLLRALSEPGPATNDCNSNGLPDDCELCGDLDTDDDVDYDDYVLFQAAFGAAADGAPLYDYCVDYDNTGAVGLADYDAWLACYRDFIGDPLAGPPADPNGDSLQSSVPAKKERRSSDRSLQSRR